MRTRWLWVKNNWKRLPHPIRWVVAATVGGALVIVGLTGLVLPVIPGIPLMFAGFALLASEFTWAEVILNRTKAQVTKAVNKVRKTDN
ncbi:MAG: hypothetical protein RJB27_1141 [Actinomycetota bacterium]|jgi:uncharacterized protein YqgC (DUF456 family)